MKKLGCHESKIKILYTNRTEKDAIEIFEETRYQVLHWREFIGCESSVIINFHEDGDDTWKILQNASRAQQLVSDKEKFHH